MPEISIIVPVYKVEQFLPGCIESILAQTFPDFELLLIDDGSPDESGKICDEYAEKDARIRVIHKENGGASAARNAGLDWAKGNYIMFCDGDDYAEPTWAEHLYATVSGGDAVIGVCGCYLVSMKTDRKAPRLPDTDPLIPFSRYYDLRLASLDQFIWNKIFIKKNIDAAELRFDEKMPYAEDAIFVMSYLRRLKGMIGVCNECLYDYRTNPESISHKYIPKLWACYRRVFRTRERLLKSFDVDMEPYRAHYADNLLKCAIFSINNYLSDQNGLTVSQQKRHLRKIVKSRYFAKAVADSEFPKCRDDEIVALKSRNTGKIYDSVMQSKYPGHKSRIYKVGKAKRSESVMLLDKVKNAFAEGGFRGFCSKVKAKILILFYKTVYSLRCRGPYIILESVPNLSDNTKEVYDEMIRRGLNEKYRILWASWKDEERDLPEKNCSVVDLKKSGIRNSERVDAIMRKAKCVVCCNRFIRSQTPKAKVYYLTHGSPIKSTRSYYNVPTSIDYCISPAQGMNEVISYEFNYPLEKVVPLGFPRNDAFARPHASPYGLFPHPNKKIIVWYPTYRQHAKWEARTNSTNAIPILHNADLATRLNEYAKSLDVLIILKPHFAQNVSYITDLKLSNILFIDDSFFETHGVSSYEFIGSCDALLTDYSSVYFDYLLADKPIGAVWEDIAEYRENPGFALDLDHYLAGAEKIYTIDDLEKFIGNVASGTDNLAKERRTVCEEVNYSYDGKNAERVVDFIIKNSNL